jgi:rubrerythrin
MKQFDTVDEVLDFAIAREIEAHDFYKDLAETVQKPDLRKTLQNFAIDELEHRVKLKAVKAGKFRIKPERIGRLGIADILKPMQPRPGMSYVETLVIAMRKEKEAFKLYVDLAKVAQAKKLKNMFLLLAQEEANHKLQLEIEYDLETF